MTIKFGLIFLPLICSTLLSQPILDGAVTVLQSTPNTKYCVYKIEQKMLTTNTLSVLKTYDIGLNTFEVNTKSNESVSLLFPNKSAVKINPNSNFRVDMMDLSVKETNEFPTKVIVCGGNLNMSMTEGEGLFSTIKIQPTDQITLQTSLSNFGLETGKYYITSSLESVVVYILEGTLSVFDNVTNKKESIKDGFAILIKPPTLSTKQSEVFSDTTTTIVKKMKPEQFKSMLDELNIITTMSSDIIFIYMDSKVVAVKVN